MLLRAYINKLELLLLPGYGTAARDIKFCGFAADLYFHVHDQQNQTDSLKFPVFFSFA